MLLPESPAFATTGERRVWELLRDGLADDALLLANLRITDRTKDHEIDIAVVLPGAAIITVEVKGSTVWHDGDRWLQRFNGRDKVIDPVAQAREGKYALRSYVEGDSRWGSRGRVRWAHAVVLTNSELGADFALPDCPRWSIIDRDQLASLPAALWKAATMPDSNKPAPDADDARVIAEILRGRGLPQRDLVAVALEREDAARLLTAEQATILSAIRLLHRVEVRGGAGSGKTWLALEQARRLAVAGERVALLCYSRGLAEFLRRFVHGLPRRQQPAYVGEYHALGVLWGAETGPGDDDSDYWERRLPAEMLALAAALPSGDRFDSIVVDEAQDFADSWWSPLMASLREPETGGLYVFSDDGQRVFARSGGLPVPLVPLVLDHNLRNTKQIAETFDPLSPMRMRARGGDGVAVRLIACRPEEAIERADDEVDRELEAGWRPEDVALLTTGARHPQQVALQEGGPAHYWDSFYDTDQVFYGHVLGFKGLERRVVVLALNEPGHRDRARERLYVGLSRARDELIVCGDPDWISEVGGDAVLRRITIQDSR